MMSYSVGQLLKWCREDHLIDSYELSGDSVVITTGLEHREMRRDEARKFLFRLLRRAHAGPPGSTPDTGTDTSGNSA